MQSHATAIPMVRPPKQRIFRSSSSTLARRKVIVTERRACAGHFIGGYRRAHAAAAHQNAALHFFTGHSPSEGERKVRVVIVVVIDFVAKIDDLVAFFRSNLASCCFISNPP